MLNQLLSLGWLYIGREEISVMAFGIFKKSLGRTHKKLVIVVASRGEQERGVFAGDRQGA